VSKPLLTLEVRLEHDVVLARQRARQLAGLLGFDAQDQTRIATAVSEVVRNAFQYAGGGKVELLLEGQTPATFVVRVSDRGPGIKDLQSILDGRYVSATGMGVGLTGVRRLMDRFGMESTPGSGTTVVLGKALPRQAPALTPAHLARVLDELARRPANDPFAEVRQQNQELLQALEELNRRQEQLAQLNRELQDTNRGVVALYAELDEKADSLRRASEMKSRFLSHMSHEFRTPLNSILSLARILEDRIDGDLTAEQEKQVAFIRKAAEGLSELVNDLLDLAQVEVGKVVIRPQEIDVPALFGALRGMLRPLLGHNAAVALVFEEPAALPPLCSDESKVAQILRNFISNALKFTERGEVRVSARQGVEGTVFFAVADTGLGIAAKDQEAIFEEFVQVENARQKRVKGTGLGLPLSRKLAELLGGSVAVQSELGVGSTFTLTLPCVYRGSAVASYAGEKVLIVDDNEVSRYLLRGLLADTHFEVIEAASGEEGLRLAARERPQAIFLDLNMPGLDGFEVLTALRAELATRHIPVIIHTAKVLEERERQRLAGAAVLSKEAPSREAALTRLHAALAAAGLGGGAVGKAHA
jgi:signal transduction histidine kinase/CheY-like chemotaxis protein